MDMDRLIQNSVKPNSKLDETLELDISIIQREQATLIQMEESKMDFSLWDNEESEEDKVCQQLQNFITDLELNSPQLSKVNRMMTRLN